MARSLRVNQQSIKAVKQAMVFCGYLHQQDLADAAMLSLSTVNRFVNGKAVDVSAFKVLIAVPSLYLVFGLKERDNC
jgi:hypothetical protein